MKRILCLIDSIGSGGAQRQIVGLAGLLKKAGYDVDLACYHNDYFFEKELQENHVPLLKLKPTSNKLSKFATVHRLMRASKYDVVIAYILGPGVISCIAKIFLSKRFRLIVSERNVTPEISTMQKIKFQIYSLLADNVISNSYTQNEIIQSRFKRLKPKSSTITNFVDTDFFSPAENVRDTGHEAIRILVVARVIAVKNTVRFIRACKTAFDKGVRFKVDWYGIVDNAEYWERCRQAMEENDASSFFEFHEPSTAILKRYQECDVLCLPSLSEGCPNVIAEAMSCGKPILCSNVCDNPIIVDEGLNGFLFNPRSEEEIAAAIGKFSRLSEESRKEFGRQSRLKALELFSKESFIQKYINLIEA